MNKLEHPKQNRLAHFRKQMGFSQRAVAHLLDHRSHAALSSYEHGRVVPTLENALRLEIALRTPVAFLFPELYEKLRKEVRDKEEHIRAGQQVLIFKN
jgi:transcriptional regulator with XRE-family HTH domain